MAVRYFIKYFDTIGIEHKLNIYDDAYVGDALQVDGNVTLTYADTDNVLEAIRGQGLSVELEANKDLTFNNTPLSCPTNTSNVTITTTGGTGALEYRITGPVASATAYQASNIFTGFK